MLNITDGRRSFQLTYEGRTHLEMALDRSPYGRRWDYINDFLFDINVWRKLDIPLHVNSEQYDVLYSLAYGYTQ